MTGEDDDIPVVGLGMRFEENPVGFRFRTIGRTITEADITLFVGVTGMTEVLFTNTEYLAAQSVYGGKRLVPGALVYSMAEGLLMQSAIQGVGIAFLGTEIDVLKPTFAGDTITVTCEVVEARPTGKPGRGFVRTRNTVANQHGDIVLIYTPKRLVKGRDYDPGTRPSAG